MKKQELLERLKSQPDCFFNLQQTIAMLESVDEVEAESPTEEISKIKVANDLLDSVIAKLDLKNRKNLLDGDKNVFGIYNNKVVLEEYELNVNALIFDIRAAVVEFFDDLDVTIAKVQEPEEEFTAGDAHHNSNWDLAHADPLK
jgi:hypothetical protein